MQLRRTITLLLFAAIVVSLSAMPAWRGEIEKKLADGSTILVTLQGDRYLHYYTSEDGRWWKEKNGVLVEIPKADEKMINNQRRVRRRVTQNINQATPLNIAPKGLIILANFNKTYFNSKNSLEGMTEMHNGDNYTYGGATGSARQYFIDQSRGLYKPHFDVVGPVNLTHEYSYYGKDMEYEGEVYEGEDEGAIEMIVEACQLADKNFNVDFTQYDHNNDGEVDFVYVIYAGFGQAEGADENTIWPHSYWVSDFHGEEAGGVTCIIDGKKINTYACGPELKGYSGSTRSGIGTFCHEFSHVLGLPDLYITVNGVNHRTMGSWDILDYGAYNNKGRTPPAYSAYERFFLGWIKPAVLNKAGTYELPEIQELGSAAIITSTGNSNLQGNDPNPSEFYILENRQLTKWDAYLAGHGMMITKVKYNYQTWYDNTVNNTKSNMGVDIIEAKANTSTKYDKETDLFPAGANSYTPYSNYPITNITESDGMISFDFMGGGERITLDIDELTEEDETILAIYNIFGQQVSAKELRQLLTGVYIIKTNKSTKKVFVTE